MAYQSCRQRASAGATASPTSPSSSRGRASSSSIARSVRARRVLRRTPPVPRPPRRPLSYSPPSRLAPTYGHVDHASPLFPADARSPSCTHFPPEPRAPLCTGEARGAALRRRAPMPPLGDCPVHPQASQGRIRQDADRPVIERVDTPRSVVYTARTPTYNSNAIIRRVLCVWRFSCGYVARLCVVSARYLLYYNIIKRLR